MLLVAFIFLSRLSRILALLENRGTAEVKSRLLELSETLLNVCVGCEEHENATLDGPREPRKHQAERTETPWHVLIFEIELELVTVKVLLDHCRKHLLICNEVIVDLLDFELCFEVLI